MADTLRVENFGQINVKERALINADAAAGQTSVTLNNNQNIATDDFVLLGTPGSQTAEIIRVASLSGTTGIVATANLSHSHSRYEDATVLNGNQIILYRAANVNGSAPDDGDFSVLGSATAIDADQVETDIVDASGGSSYWYKFKYKNSVTSAETSLSASVANRGGGYGDYCSIERIRREAGLETNRFITDGRIDEKRRAAQDEINAALVDLYVLPFSDPVPDIIQEITAQLAAGLLLTSPTAGRFSSTYTEGESKLKQARAELLKIQEKQKSVTVNGESIAIVGTNAFKMYPDRNTVNSQPEDGGARFSVADRY